MYVVGFNQAHYKWFPEDVWNAMPDDACIDVRNWMPNDPKSKRHGSETMVDTILGQEGYVGAVVATVETCLQHNRVMVGSHFE